MSRYFPLFVDLEQKKIVVVGAGRIAERRIQTLLSFEAQITVIAPEASVKIRKLAKEGRLHWQQERWSPEAESFLDGSLFVLAAVDDGAVNKAVFRACRARGIPVNCSDDRTRAIFIFRASRKAAASPQALRRAGRITGWPGKPLNAFGSVWQKYEKDDLFLREYGIR